MKSDINIEAQVWNNLPKEILPKRQRTQNKNKKKVRKINQLMIKRM